MAAGCLQKRGGAAEAGEGAAVSDRGKPDQGPAGAVPAADNARHAAGTCASAQRARGTCAQGKGGWREAGGEKRTAEKLSGGIRKVPMMFCGRRGSGEKPHKEIGCSINNYTLQVGNKGRESKALKAPHGKCSPLANG